MNRARIEELCSDYSKALRRLEEALNEDVSKGGVVIDGTIQRFEFTFEIAWKLLRGVLGYEGIDVNAPRTAIKEAYAAEFILAGDDWINMLEDRNKTSHIYDEEQAKKIYDRIKETYLANFRGLEKSVANFLAEPRV